MKLSFHHLPKNNTQSGHSMQAQHGRLNRVNKQGQRLSSTCQMYLNTVHDSSAYFSQYQVYRWKPGWMEDGIWPNLISSHTCEPRFQNSWLVTDLSHKRLNIHRSSIIHQPHITAHIYVLWSHSLPDTKQVPRRAQTIHPRIMQS